MKAIYLLVIMVAAVGLCWLLLMGRGTSVEVPPTTSTTLNVDVIIGPHTGNRSVTPI